MVCLSVLWISCIPSGALADWRRYAWTYEYMTMRRNTWELENYMTFKVPSWANSNTNSIEEWIELEYGITDHWDLAVYNMFLRSNKASGKDEDHYKGFKVRTRYRFGEKGKYPLDPLLYFEWIREDYRDRNPNKLEGKFILAKDIGKFNISYNQIIESRLGSGGRTEQKYAVGANYAIIPTFRLGVESTGDYYQPGNTKEKIHLGPTLAWANKYFWISGGFLFGANRAGDDFQSRILVGIPF